MGKIMRMPHYGMDLANKKWGNIIQNVWDKLNELVDAINKLNPTTECEWCGVAVVVFRKDHGYPVVCRECWKNATPEERKGHQRANQKDG